MIFFQVPPNSEIYHMHSTPMDSTLPFIQMFSKALFQASLAPHLSFFPQAQFCVIKIASVLSHRVF